MLRIWLALSMNFTNQQHFEKFVHKGLSLAIYLKILFVTKSVKSAYFVKVYLNKMSNCLILIALYQSVMLCRKPGSMNITYKYLDIRESG